ncbi:MAG: hypothetical protein LQ337_007262 [Flavoplaca oasis]|nr:MAG: hypothetical protein LQ337_007262 [Flavoplaca oasis]
MPQNAKEVRDCICGSDYWVQLTRYEFVFRPPSDSTADSALFRCRECLRSKNLYPENAPNDVTPIAAMSTSFCSPDGGRTNTKTIDGWVDGNAHVDQVNRLMPITTISTDEPSPNTGLGGVAVETVIPETVFDSLISAAATETALVSALDSSSGVTGQSSSTSPQEILAASTTSSPTMGSGGSPNTSAISTSTSAMAGDAISSTVEAFAPDASSDDSAVSHFMTVFWDNSTLYRQWIIVIQTFETQVSKPPIARGLQYENSLRPVHDVEHQNSNVTRANLV